MAGVNRIKRAWPSDRPAFGLWFAIPDPFVVELASALELEDAGGKRHAVTARGLLAVIDQ
jgi:hypothetical protein